MVDYQLIADVLIYVGVVQLFSRFALRVVTASMLSIGGIFVLNFVLRVVIAGLALTVGSFIVTALQFAAALGVFYKLRENDDSIGAYFGWAVVGLAVILFVIPMAAMRLGIG